MEEILALLFVIWVIKMIWLLIYDIICDTIELIRGGVKNIRKWAKEKKDESRNGDIRCLN